MSTKFTVPITGIHQIEITSRCNLKCVYCPSPLLGKPGYRAKQDMDMATYARTLELVNRFVRVGTQTELNLAGIGESTIHPAFIEYVRLARAALGWNQRLTLATNGLALTESMVQAIKPYDLRLYVSMHRPEKAGLAIDLARKYGLYEGASADPSLAPNDWGGQVKWVNNSPKLECPWLSQGWVSVFSDGAIGSCCMDATGATIIGHVNDDISTLRNAPSTLCQKCWQVIKPPAGVRGFDQSKVTR